MTKYLCFILFLFCFISISPAETIYFSGEVYKINKYERAITCRSADLTQIKVGMTLYIVDENNKQIASAEVTRYYTTVIETKLISGDISAVKIKMPVYSSKSQFEKKVAQVIKYEKDYDYYWWDVDVIYNVEGKEYKLPSKMIFPKIVELLIEGSATSVKLAIEEFAEFHISENIIIKIKLKDGTKGNVKNINVYIKEEQIPKKEFIENISRILTKKINLDINDAKVIKLLNRVEGAEISADYLNQAKKETVNNKPITKENNHNQFELTLMGVWSKISSETGEGGIGFGLKFGYRISDLFTIGLFSGYLPDRKYTSSWTFPDAGGTLTSTQQESCIPINFYGTIGIKNFYFLLGVGYYFCSTLYTYNSTSPYTFLPSGESKYYENTIAIPIIGFGCKLGGSSFGLDLGVICGYLININRWPYNIIYHIPIGLYFGF